METGEYAWEAVDRKTEIPRDRQTGRLAREHENRGTKGQGDRGIYMGTMKTEIPEAGRR